MKTYFQLVQFIKNELDGHYPIGEINSFIGIIFKYLEQITITELHMKYETKASDVIIRKVEKIVLDLKINKPIQHIIGNTEFYGLEFMVSPNVLIPRQETEELVDWVINDNKDRKGLEIVDIGTGSGCIAIALEKNLDCRKVEGMDISKKALKIAKQNSGLNKSKVLFKRKDILILAEKRKKYDFDIVVSNPPYVTHSEKTIVHANVVENEPHLALFVEDSNPLIFYDAICQYSKRSKKKEVHVYFEINENFGTEIFNLLIGHKFDEVVLKKDLNGKERMIKGVFRKSY